MESLPGKSALGYLYNCEQDSASVAVHSAGLSREWCCHWSSQSPHSHLQPPAEPRDVSWAQGTGAGLQLISFAGSTSQDLCPCSFIFQRKPLLSFWLFSFSFHGLSALTNKCKALELGKHFHFQTSLIPSPRVLPGTNIPWRAWQQESGFYSWRFILSWDLSLTSRGILRITSSIPSLGWSGDVHSTKWLWRVQTRDGRGAEFGTACPELPGDPGVGRTFPGRAGQQLQHRRRKMQTVEGQPGCSWSLWLISKSTLKMLHFGTSFQAGKGPGCEPLEGKSQWSSRANYIPNNTNTTKRGENGVDRDLLPLAPVLQRSQILLWNHWMRIWSVRWKGKNYSFHIHAQFTSLFSFIIWGIWGKSSSPDGAQGSDSICGVPLVAGQ